MKKVLNKNGFTIVEIIVTLAVLGIVIAPLMTMFITSQRINNEGSKEYKSIQLAQKYMEEIKAMGELNTTEFPYDSSEGVYKPATTPILDEGYNIYIEIEPSGEGGTIGGTLEEPTDYSTLKINDATVEWNEAPLHQGINDGKVDTAFKSGETTIAGNVINSTAKQNIKVILSTNASINITNELENNLNLYIFNIDNDNGKTYNCTVNVLKGEVNTINNNSVNEIKKTAKNVLYNIKIEVKKGTDPINTVYGTTIFKYEPN